MRTVGPLIRRDTHEVVLDSVEIADGFWSRLRGLQFRPMLTPGTGLLLIPCQSIHTFFMRFPIDVVTLDQDARVLEIRPQLLPWRTFVPKSKPWAILEVPAGTTRLQPGIPLGLAQDDDRAPGKHLQFLQFNCNNTS